MTHEELRKECYEAFVRAAVKIGKLETIEDGMNLYEESLKEESVSALIDAMMEVAAKAWEKGYETSWLDDQYPNTGKSINPYLKPEQQCL